MLRYASQDSLLLSELRGTDTQQKSYNLCYPRVVAPTTETEIMDALQSHWTGEVSLANPANIAAHTLLHAISRANGDNETAIGFLASALQTSERLISIRRARGGRQDLDSSDAWVIWAAYCEAVFSGHRIAWQRKPPAVPIPEPGRDRDHKIWTPPFHSGPSRAGLESSILRARCSLAVLVAEVAAHSETFRDEVDVATAVFDLQQGLSEWHADLPFPLQILHNATPQHLLLL